MKFRADQQEIVMLNERAKAGEMVLAYVDEAGFECVHPNRSARTDRGQVHEIEVMRRKRLNMLGPMLSTGEVLAAKLWGASKNLLYRPESGLSRSNSSADEQLMTQASRCPCRRFAPRKGVSPPSGQRGRNYALDQPNQTARVVGSALQRDGQRNARQLHRPPALATLLAQRRKDVPDLCPLAVDCLVALLDPDLGRLSKLSAVGDVVRQCQNAGNIYYSSIVGVQLALLAR